MFWRAVVLVVIASYCVLSKATEIPLEQLVMGISDRSAFINNFSVTCDYKVTQRELTTGKLEDPLIVHAVITIDMSGRLKYESFDEKEGSKKSDERHNVVAYNGSVMKTLIGNNQSFLWGSVKEKTNNPPWFMDPRSYLYHYYGNSVEKILSEPTAHIVGTEVWDGQNVIVAEVIYKQEKVEETSKMRFLINTEQGFSVVRRSFLTASPTTHNKWFEYAYIEGRGYTEVVPGLWLPSKIISQYSPMPSPEDPVPAFDNRTEIVNTNWIVNAKLPDGIFELTFPSGIMVKDEQTGKIYRTTDIKASSLGQDAIKGQELYRKRTRSSSRLLLIATIPLAALIALILYRISRKRRDV